MKSFGITLAEGSDISNLTVDSGTAFPAEANIGELFYLTGKGLHLFNGDKWILDVLNDYMDGWPETYAEWAIKQTPPAPPPSPAPDNP